MKKRVLIIEDDKDSMQLLRKIVTEIDSEAEIYTTDDPGEAYRYSNEVTIEMFLVDIILDINRPSDVAGIKFIENIRKLQKYEFTPVIFTTSMEDPMLYVYKELHSFSFIEKPFEISRAKKIISQAMRYQSQPTVSKNLYFRKGCILYSVAVDDIVCVQNSKQSIEVQTVNQTLCIPYLTCKQIMVEADSDKLIRCSRSIIVNKDYIENIDTVNKYIKMTGSYGFLKIGSTYNKRLLRELSV